MAAVSAQRHSQDVSFQNFTPETELSKHDDDCVEDDIEEIVASDVEAAAEQVKDEEDTDSNDQHKAEVESKGKFTLGIDDGAEFMDELSFSIQHCGLSQQQPGAGGHDEDVVVEGDHGQPPPGHWVSQPHGESSYFFSDHLITELIVYRPRSVFHIR